MADDWKAAMQASIDVALKASVPGRDKATLVAYAVLSGLLRLLHAKGVLSDDELSTFEKTLVDAATSFGGLDP